MSEELHEDEWDDVLDDDSDPELFAGFILAVDGPAGSGKSSVAARVAEILDLPHLDTGALYRAAALACLRANTPLDDAAACAATLASATVSYDKGDVWLDGEKVTDAIRTHDVTAAVSHVAKHAEVRALLLSTQRTLGATGGVLEGRDIATVVFPDADLKVFLTASNTERARRRAEQTNDPRPLDELAAELAARDALDADRQHSPFALADDAWVLDTTDMTIEDTIEAVVDEAYRRRFDADNPKAISETAVDPLAFRRALPRVVVVGRPNVGKSSLVNRILGERVAIVEERPGVTRDRTEHEAEWLGTRFLLVDTGGWEHKAEGLAEQIVVQAERAIADADAVLFVVDATIGALDDDERYARLLRRQNIPLFLVANKIDGPKLESVVHELYGLGLGTAAPVSARHGRGVGDLLDDVIAALPTPDGSVDDFPRVPRVAIVGRPNVGKSSLFNMLLGEERSIVDAVAHTTRDAIDTMVSIDGKPWVFVDTAGMRRRYRHGEDTELYSVDRTRDAIASADLVLFVVDASEPISEQDQRLAGLLRDAGRGLIMVCNKWDQVDEDTRLKFERDRERMLGFAAWAPRVNVSALTGRNVTKLMPALESVWENYLRRIPTRELNRVISGATAQHSPPRRGQRPVTIRYVTQAEVGPPRVVLFANGRIPHSYRRYLERILREYADFTGVPIMIDDRPPTREHRNARGRGR
ncbi:MAG: ribosome biogenesis GTPase Der [Nitriliruptoraceae bacterium]